MSIEGDQVERKNYSSEKIMERKLARWTRANRDLIETFVDHPEMLDVVKKLISAKK
ncbi:MAG TPA: hypothetical protein PKY58_10845 [Syntrophales bacterium]|nr:hypothetical protein [Syntrophales bacterium]HQQ28020.1 hypothetical protein [Syntrophales bacterium]